MSPQTSPLFRPVKLGALELRNRILMAPMTRARAGLERIPTASMATHYAQRAGAGLIITEATQVSVQGTGSAFTPVRRWSGTATISALRSTAPLG